LQPLVAGFPSALDSLQPHRIVRSRQEKGKAARLPENRQAAKAGIITEKTRITARKADNIRFFIIFLSFYELGSANS
jgi:hypothetical protein